MNNTVTFLGTRGGAPAVTDSFKAYGAETSSYAIKLNETVIIVDCGTGITRANKLIDEMDEIHVLLTHTHLDHIAGLFHLKNMVADKPLHIYGPTYDSLTIKEQIDRLIGPPIWPSTLEDDITNITFHDVDGEFDVKDIHVSTMESNHNGGCTLYRLDGNNASVVVAADFDHGHGYDEKLAVFAKDADLLIYDGCMSTGEYVLKNKRGHSTADAGAEIGKKANVKTVAITHHGNRASDDELDLREHDLRTRYDNLFFAYNGLTYVLGDNLPAYCNTDVHSAIQGDKFQTLMDISINLTSENNQEKLYEQTLNSALEITSADGGVLFTLEDNRELKPRASVNRSLGIAFYGDTLDIAPTIKLELSNIAAAAAITKKKINIEDINQNDEFDFSKTKSFDHRFDIYTTSCLVIPMENVKGEVIGVIQLHNKIDASGRTVAFTHEDEETVAAIAALAGVSISNILYASHITNLLTGFVRGISTGIDARTAYNANHTRNMVAYANAFLEYEKAKWGPYAMENEEKTELNMAIWLHDIGKLATPLEVMDKAKRLTPEHFERIENRYGRMELLLHLSRANGEITEEEFKKKHEELLEEHQFILDCNSAGFLTNDRIARIELISFETYTELNGEEMARLDPTEIHELCIQKGTLTSEERHVMQEHVEVTEKMLSMLDFPKDFKQVASWASTHHEFLDGSGYPHHLTAEDLSWPARFITILDIFEALTAADRPYRASMTVNKALNILDSMVKEGKLDGDIVAEFKESKAWEETLSKREKEIVLTVSDWRKI